MNKKEPVFVCGLARSGTTWISSRLGQSDELQYLRESWMIAKLHDLASWYSKIYNNWDKSFLTWKSNEVDIPTFTKHLGGFYNDLLLEASKGKRYIEKTPHWNVEYLEFLVELFPEANYILIYRDGRNQVASLELFNKKKNMSFDFEESCKKWADGMDKFKNIKENDLIANYRLVKYEELLSNFDEEFRNLCEFLSVTPFNPKPNDPNSSYPAAESKLDFNNRWKSWSEEKKTIFKESAGTQLIEWNYETANDSW